MQKVKPEVSALIAVILWSTVGTAFKLSLRYLTPFGLLFLSSLFSLVILFLINLVKGSLRGIWDFRRVVPLLLIGFLVPFLYYLLLFQAYDLLYAHEALILNYTWPIWFSVFSFFFHRERFLFNRVVGLLLGFAGVVIIAARQGELRSPEPIGVIFALLSGIVWGIYWNLQRMVETTTEAKLFFSFLSGCTLLVIFGFLSGKIPFPLGIQAITGALYVGAFEMSLTFLLWLNAIEKAKSTAFVANIAFLAPVLSVFWIWLVLKEPIDLSVFAALFCVLLGVYVTSSRSS